MLLRELADVNRIYDETSMRIRNSKSSFARCTTRTPKVMVDQTSFAITHFSSSLTSITFLFRLRENDAVMPHHEAERRICAFVFMAM